LNSEHLAGRGDLLPEVRRGLPAMNKTPGGLSVAGLPRPRGMSEYMVAQRPQNGIDQSLGEAMRHGTNDQFAEQVDLAILHGMPKRVPASTRFVDGRAVSERAERATSVLWPPGIQRSPFHREIHQITTFKIVFHCNLWPYPFKVTTPTGSVESAERVDKSPRRAIDRKKAGKPRLFGIRPARREDPVLEVRPFRPRGLKPGKQEVCIAVMDEVDQFAQ